MEIDVQTDVQTPKKFIHYLILAKNTLTFEDQVNVSLHPTAFPVRCLRKDLLRKREMERPHLRYKSDTLESRTCSYHSPMRNRHSIQTPSPVRLINASTPISGKVKLPLLEKVPRRLKPLRKVYGQDLLNVGHWLR